MCFFISGIALAESQTTEKTDLFNSVLKSRVERYKKNLAQLAQNPMLIAAVKEANKKTAADHLSNTEWKALAEDDPQVYILNKNATGDMLAKFEKSRAFEKLNVRDAKGYLVAFSSANEKPLLYNAAERPPVMNGLKGIWSASEIKPDPTTKKMTIQIAAPILADGVIIGVVHSSVTAE